MARDRNAEANEATVWLTGMLTGFPTCRFVLAHVFQLVLAIDALVAKNTIQVFALLLFNTLFMVYALVQVRLSFRLVQRGALLEHHPILTSFLRADPRNPLPRYQLSSTSPRLVHPRVRSSLSSYLRPKTDPLSFAQDDHPHRVDLPRHVLVDIPRVRLASLEEDWCGPADCEGVLVVPGFPVHPQIRYAFFSLRPTFPSNNLLPMIPFTSPLLILVPPS